MVAAAGLFAGWLKTRESGLRRKEVLSWANEAITAMQELVILYTPGKILMTDQERANKIQTNTILTSLLVEKGRMFFKNTQNNNYSVEKERAYRGYRPKILDNILISHEVGVSWQTADNHLKKNLRLVAEDCLKKFVSQAQLEVGRSRTAVLDTGMPGQGLKLADYIQNIEQNTIVNGPDMLGTDDRPLAGASRARPF